MIIIYYTLEWTMKMMSLMQSPESILILLTFEELSLISVQKGIGLTVHYHHSLSMMEICL